MKPEVIRKNRERLDAIIKKHEEAIRKCNCKIEDLMDKCEHKVLKHKTPFKDKCISIFQYCMYMKFHFDDKFFVCQDCGCQIRKG